MNKNLAIDEHNISFFREQGYVYLPKLIDPDLISDLSDEICSMINLRLGALGLDSPEPLHQGLALLRKESREAAVALYQTMRKLVALQSIISSRPVQSAAIALLGTRHLISSAQSIRYDPPQGNELLIDWHQDYPFIQDSEDSLVFWFPLADLSPTSGGVRLLPGSHLNGIRTVRRVRNPHGSGHWLKQVEEINETDSVFPQIQRGDALVMHTLTLHRSELNTSDKVRWTGQFRLGNYAHHRAVDRLWPRGMTDGEDFAERHSAFIAAESEAPLP